MNSTPLYSVLKEEMRPNTVTRIPRCASTLCKYANCLLSKTVVRIKFCECVLSVLSDISLIKESTQRENVAYSLPSSVRPYLKSSPSNPSKNTIFLSNMMQRYDFSLNIPKTLKNIKLNNINAPTITAYDRGVALSVLFLDEKVTCLNDGRADNHDSRVDGRRVFGIGVGDNGYADCLQASDNARDQGESFFVHNLKNLNVYNSAFRQMLFSFSIRLKTCVTLREYCTLSRPPRFQYQSRQ